MATPAAVLAVMVKAQGVRATNAQLASVQGNLQKTGAVGTRMGNAIDKGMKVAGAGIAYGLFKGAQAGINFEKRMDAVGAVSDATGRQMRKLEKQALKLGEKTAFSAGEAAEAQEELAKGGIAVRDILKGGLPAALSLAAAGELELAEAAETTVNALKLFNLRGTDASKVADMMATAANSTTADVADFAMALKQGGSVAKQAGLDLNQTMQVLEALAEAGIKNSDAGTSMKAAFLQLLAPTEKQANLAERLGISWVNQAGGMKSVTQISRILRRATDEMGEAERAKTLKVLAGSDGFRTLAALYDAGPAKLERLSRANREHGTAQEIAKRKMDNTAGSIEELLGSLETLAIKGFKRINPALRSVVDTATGVVNDIGKVLDDDSLSPGQKIAELINRAVPAALEAGKNVARAVGQGFVAAWMDMNFGAKLFTAAALIRLAGGKGALMASGAALGRWIGIGMGAGIATSATVGAGAGAAIGVATTKQAVKWVRGPGGAMVAEVGTAMGAGIATSAATTVAGGGGAGGGLLAKLRTTLLPAAGRAGLLGVGILLGDQLIKGIGKRLAEQSDDLFTSLSAKTSAGGIGSVAESIFGKTDASRNAQEVLRTLERIRDKGARITLDQAQTVRQTARFLDLTRQQKQTMNRLLDVGVDRYERMAGNQRKAATMSDQFARNLRGLRISGSKDFDGLVRSVVFGSRNILDVGGRNSRKTREEVARQFDIARQRVRQAMNQKIISVKEGTARLHQLAKKELGLYGISAGRVNVVLAKGANGEMRPHQRGGPITTGAPSGDSVPALLERGEYVLNRNAVRKIGVGNLDRVNFAGAPRFQTGGIVELLHPGNDPDHHDHLHVAMSTPAAVVALGRRLQQMGWQVSEHPAFGGVNFEHAAGGYHYTAQAIDVNWPDPGVEAAKIAALLPMLGAPGFGRTFEGLPRVALQGPPSVALEAGQGALDRIRSAADAAIARAVAPIEGAEFGAGAVTGSGAGLMRQIAAQRGWSFPHWWELDRRETGHGTDLFNEGSGAALRGQFMPGITQGNYGPGSAPWLNPSMAQQIVSMADYITERYGSPTDALAHHDVWNWYQSGGLVGMQKGGLTKALTRTLKSIRTGKTPKIRGEKLRALLGKIKDVGLPEGLENRIGALTRDAEVFGDMASRAGQLTFEPTDAEGNPLLDPDGRQVVEWGQVGGLTEVGWLGKQLDAMFQLRNKIVRAQEIAVEKREALTRLIEQAQQRLREVAEQIRAAAKRRRDIEGELETLRTKIEKARDRLERLRERPKRNADEIERTRERIMAMVGEANDRRAQIRDIDANQNVRERERKAIKDRVIPTLTGQRSKINTARGEMLSTLDTVQGPGSPMGHLGSLPTLGVLGGDIFNVQMRINELNAPKPVIRDAAAPDTGSTADDSARIERLELEAALGRLATQRLAVSEAHLRVFQGFSLPFGGTFHTGGIVPGPAGEERAALVRAGEGVFTPGQMAAIGGDGVTVQVTIYEGEGRAEVIVNDRVVEAAVERVTRRHARGAGRGLPGRGGGMT